jgi:DNA-binding transcriptional regulator YiaG
VFRVAESDVFHADNFTGNSSESPCISDAQPAQKQCRTNAQSGRGDYVVKLTERWTGRTACALQEASGLSNEAYAERLGIAVRTVGSWHEKPNLVPQSAMQEILDTALDQASPAAKERFARLVPEAISVQPSADIDHHAEDRLSADPNISAALDWLDQHADWAPGTARRRVTAHLTDLDIRELRDRGAERGRASTIAVRETRARRTCVSSRSAIFSFA